LLLNFPNFCMISATFRAFFLTFHAFSVTSAFWILDTGYSPPIRFTLHEIRYTIHEPRATKNGRPNAQALLHKNRKNKIFFIPYHTSTYEFWHLPKCPNYRPNAQVRPNYRGARFFQTPPKIRNTRYYAGHLTVEIRNMIYAIRYTLYVIRYHLLTCSPVLLTAGYCQPLYTCREASTNSPFYAKRTQIPKKSNEPK